MSETKTSCKNTSEIVDAVKDAFSFDIEKFPLSGPDGMRTPHYGLFRSDNAEHVGSAVRSGYTPHTTEDVVALAEAASGAFHGRTEVSTIWNEGHELVIGPSRESRFDSYFSADPVWPRFIIRAGYDGTAFSATLGLYRDACRNLQIIRDARKSFSIRIVHRHSLRDNMDALIRDFGNLSARWDNVVDIVDQMKNREVVLSNFISELYPVSDSDTERQKRAAVKRSSMIVDRIIRERAKLTGVHGSIDRVTAWEAYNGVQGHIQHESKRHGNPSHLKRAMLALNDSQVKSAFELAVSA